MKDFDQQQWSGIERVFRRGVGIFFVIFGIAFAAMPAQFIWDIVQKKSVDAGDTSRWFFVIFLSIFVIAGLSVVFKGVRLLSGKGPVFPLRGSSVRRRNEGSQSSMRERSSSGGRWFGSIFGLIFFLVGCGLFYGLTIRPVLAIEKAKSWQPVLATVTHSEVKEHSDSDGDTYSIDIGYCYQIDGEAMSGNRYSFFGGSSSGYDGKKAVVDHYPVGHEFYVFINPDSPSESVICRGFTGQSWMMIFPVPFVVMGLFVMGISWRQARPLRLSYGVSRRRVDSLPLELQPSKSRFGRVGMLLFMGLFWNGIVSVFVVEVIRGWKTGNGEIGGTLFMVPFVLIGLGIIGAFIWSLMKLSNPRVIVTLNHGEIVLGVPVSGRLRIEGAAHRLEHLTLSLVGREEACYQRGTTSHTEKRDFYNELLLEKNLMGGVLNGEVRFTVPGNSMHSFAGLHNKIIWLLRVEGTLQRWPNMNDEYPIEVLPSQGMGS